VCPWHGARYDVETGRMVRGPQGSYAKVLLAHPVGAGKTAEMIVGAMELHWATIPNLLLGSSARVVVMAQDCVLDVRHWRRDSCLSSVPSS
jgi:hypothetical protein